jgi:hypothetical protein
LQKNKRKNWAETIEQGLQVKESDRTSVRKIMSRLRGQSEPEQESHDLSAGNVPDSPLEAKSLDTKETHPSNTGAETTPVQILDRSNSNTGTDTEPQFDDRPHTGSNSELVNATQTTDSKPFIRGDIKTPHYTGSKITPVQVAPVAKTGPVQKLDRPKDVQKSVRGGFLRIPNTLLDTWIPKLSPTEAVVFLRLYRLSHGFNQKTCMVGTATLATTCNISENTCRTALRRLIDLEMIRQVETINSKDVKGTTYEVCFSEEISEQPHAAPEHRSKNYTGAKTEPNKNMNHDDLKNTDHHHVETRTSIIRLYEQLTGRTWTTADWKSLDQISHVQDERLEFLMRTIHNRAGNTIGSFAYFAKAILTEESGPPQMSKAALKRKYEQFAKEIRSIHVGSNEWDPSDMVFLLKTKCSREGITWNDDIANEVLG